MATHINGTLGHEILTEFFKNYQTVSGGALGKTQKEALTNFVKNLAGKNTTNGSNLLLKFHNHGTRIWPQLPKEDESADASVYSMELFTGNQLGSYNNFVGGDFTNLGVTGGSGKYFDSGVRPDDFPLDDVGHHINVRNVLATSGFDFMGVIFGAGNDNGTRYYPQTSQRSRIAVNSKFPTSFVTITNHNGFIGMQREVGAEASTRVRRTQNGAYSYTQLYSTQGITPNGNIYIHCLNNVGNATADRFNSSRINFYLLGAPSLTENELSDLYQSLTGYNQTVITGGR